MIISLPCIFSYQYTILVLQACCAWRNDENIILSQEKLGNITKPWQNHKAEQPFISMTKQRTELQRKHNQMTILLASSMNFKRPFYNSYLKLLTKYRWGRRIFTWAGAKTTPWIDTSSDGKEQAGRHRSIHSKVLVDQGLVLQLHPLRRSEWPPHPWQHPLHLASPWAQAQPFIHKNIMSNK